jgi:xylulokinase
MGAAILAATGAGLFSNASEAAQTMVRTKETFSPKPASMKKYDQFYQLFKELHDGLQPYYIRAAKMMEGLDNE